jgi:hypothetical protein
VTDTAVEQFLGTLSETLEKTRELIDISLRAEFWTPRPSSTFDGELNNTETATNGDAWGPDEPRIAYEMAQLSMTAIADHLSSIRKLLQPPLSIFGQAVLARSVFESAAFAFWMTDPAIDVRARVARSSLIFWDVAQTHLREAKKQGGTAETAAQKHLDDTRQRIANLGFTLAKAGNKWAIDPYDPIPSKTHWVADLFASNLQQGQHTKIYSPYSGLTHGEIYALTTRLLTDPGNQNVWTVTPQQLAENVELSLAAFHALYRRLSLAGMGADPNTDFEEWEDYVVERLDAIRKAITPPQTNTSPST